MEVVIDRFEGDFAVCEKENRKMINIEKKRIPLEAKEGSVLRVLDNGEIIFDKEKTLEKEKEISNILKDLWR